MPARSSTNGSTVQNGGAVTVGDGSVAAWLAACSPLLRNNLLRSALRPTDTQRNAIRDDDGQDRGRHQVAFAIGLRSMIHSGHAFSDRQRRSILEPLTWRTHMLAVFLYAVATAAGNSDVRKAAGVPRDGLCANANESRRRPRPVVPLPPDSSRVCRAETDLPIGPKIFGETAARLAASTKELRRPFRRCESGSSPPGRRRRSCRRRSGPFEPL